MISFLKQYVSPKIKYRILTSLTSFLWRFHLDLSIAKLIAMIIMYHNHAELSSGRKGVFILSFDRSIFNDDASALKEYSKTHGLPYRFLFYPSFIRAALTKTIWPFEMRAQIAYYPFRHRFRIFIDRVTKIFEEVICALEVKCGAPIKIILSGLIDYAPDYPWMAAVRCSGGKFVALNKESIIYSSKYAKITMDLYEKDKFFFEGDATLFYNEFARGVFIDAKAVDPKDTYVTGCPRVDRLTGGRKKDTGNFFILPAFQDPSYGAPQLWRDVLDTLYGDEMLRKHVLIKCRDVREISAIKNNFPEFNVVSGPMEKFLKMGPCVCVGFNSTACLDALIAEIPLIIPWWAEALKMDFGDTLLGPHTNTFHAVAEDQASLLAFIRPFFGGYGPKMNLVSWRKNPLLRNFIEEKYTALDGKNCERFFNFLATRNYAAQN